MAMELTDAANEFAEMAVFLRNISGQDTVVANSVINSQIKSSGMMNPVYEVYAAVSARANDLLEFVRTLQDPYIDNETRGFAMSATQNIASAFQANQFGTQWIGVKPFFANQHTVSLKFFSQTMRRHRPLRKINPAQIDKIRKSLMEALTELVDQGLPDWAKIPLNTGIRDLMFVLDNLMFLGHDEAISQLLTLRASAQAIHTEAKLRGQQPKFTKLAAALVLAIGVFSVPRDMKEDIELYKGWIGHYAAPAIQSLPSPEQTTKEVLGEHVTDV